MTAHSRLSPRSCAFVRLYFSVLFNSSSSRAELSAAVVFQRSQPVKCSGHVKTNVEQTASRWTCDLKGFPAEVNRGFPRADRGPRGPPTRRQNGPRSGTHLGKSAATARS